MIPTILRANVDAGDVVLAEGSIFRGNSSGVAAAHNAKTSGQILVGDGTTVASVAVSGDVTLSSAGAVTIAAGAVESSMVEASLIRRASVTCTATEVKALNATPKTLVAAQGSGTLVVVDTVTLQLNYGGTNAFTEIDDNLVVQYADGQDITASIECTGFIDQTADQVAVIYPASIATMATASAGVNQGVVLFNPNDEFAGNAADDNTLVVTVWYRVLTLA